MYEKHKFFCLKKRIAHEHVCAFAVFAPSNNSFNEFTQHAKLVRATIKKWLTKYLSPLIINKSAELGFIYLTANLSAAKKIWPK